MFSLEFAGKATGVAQSGGDIGFAAPCRRAFGKMGLIVGDDVVDGGRRQAAQALPQPRHKGLTGHFTPPRIPATAPENDAHADFCDSKLAFPAGVSR